MVPKEIGPYRVIQNLGAGGMGVVFLAEDTRLRRRVALKGLHGPSGDDATRRILREARAAARLNHQGIAAIHDVLTEDGRSFIVMEYVEGVPLTGLIAAGPVPIKQAVSIGMQLADALAYAHAAQVIHRDVKPANIMVTAGGQVKLLDMGLAQVSTVPGDETVTNSAGWLSGHAGTLPYMAPEQLRGERASARTDVYSLAVVLFELLTGRRPFQGSSALDLAVAIESKRPPKVATLRPGIPEPLAQLIDRTLAGAPESRASCAEIRSSLAAIHARLEPEAGARRWWRPYLGRGVAACLTLLTIGVVGTASLGPAGLLPWTRSPVGHAPVAVLQAVSLGANQDVQDIGPGLVAVVAENLASAPGLTVVRPPSTNAGETVDRDLNKVAHDLGAGYVLDVTVQPASDGVRVRARLVSPVAPDPLWSGATSGTALEVERYVLDGVATALEREGAFRMPLDADDRARLRRLPTESAEALRAYSRGRALLQDAGTPESAKAALQAFEEAVRKDPDFALAYAGISEAAGLMYTYTRDAGWMDRATAAGKDALARQPGSAQVNYALARVYYGTGRPADAQGHLHKALQLSPDSDDAHRLMGAILLDQGRFDAAIESLRRAVLLRPAYWLNHFHLGLAWYESARYREATAAFRRVTELRPEYPAGFQALGTAYHQLDDIENAIGNYSHALRLGESAEAYANLGYAYYTAGRLAEALPMYQKQAELDPGSPSAHRNVADVLHRLGRDAEARAAYQRAIKEAEAALAVNPRDTEHISTLALCEARIGDYESATQHAVEALVLNPSAATSLHNAAAVFATSGRIKEALAYLERAIAAGHPVVALKHDDYLEALRNRPEYLRLIDPTKK